MYDSLSFFGNGGGTCKTLDDVMKLARAPITHIEVGSITVERRYGNDVNGGVVFYADDNGTTWNAIGMTNGGIDYYRRVLPDMLSVANTAGKELVVNIAPINQGDTEKLCQLCVEAGVRFITYNGGCPNAWDQGMQKKIVSHDPEALAREMWSVFSVVRGTNMRVSVKFTAFMENDALRGEIASVLSPYPVTILGPNTLPNQRPLRPDGKPAISFRSGEQVINTGGMGGTALKPYALRELEAFRRLLPNHPFISVGSIATGEDMYERLRLGAIGVQVTSAYYTTEDLHVFGRILTEYADCPPQH